VVVRVVVERAFVDAGAEGVLSHIALGAHILSEVILVIPSKVEGVRAVAYKVQAELPNGAIEEIGRLETPEKVVFVRWGPLGAQSAVCFNPVIVTCRRIIHRIILIEERRLFLKYNDE
jgi:hypothetical protein